MEWLTAVPRENRREGRGEEEEGRWYRRRGKGRGRRRSVERGADAGMRECVLYASRRSW